MLHTGSTTLCGALFGNSLKYLVRRMSRRVENGVVPLDECRRFIVECMTAVGTSEKNSHQLADLLIAADHRGHFSHGMNRLDYYVKDIENKTCDSHGSPKIIKQTAATAWVDGCNGLGPVIGSFCMDLAMEKAKNVGIAIVTTKASNHYGIAGWYSLKAANEGLIGFNCTNTSPLLVPTRAKEAALGTNPISVATPSKNDDNVVIDMATTCVAVGKIEVKMKKEEEIPDAWALNAQGQKTTNASEAYKASRLLPLGGFELNSGYKGYGLSLLVEILCGVLGGANYGPNIRRWGTFEETANLAQCFIAINPECFAPGFENRMADLTQILRGMEPADANLPVLVPGDPERIHMEVIDKQGGINYHINQLELMDKLAEKLHVVPLKTIQRLS